MVITVTVDHCTLTHSRSIVCYLLSIAILIDLRNTVVYPSSLIFHHNYIIISLALKTQGQFVLDSTAAHQGMATPMCVLPYCSFLFHKICQRWPIIITMCNTCCVPLPLL